jgi:hypothetical protein
MGSVRRARRAAGMVGLVGADSRAGSFPGAIVVTAPRGTVFTGLPADAADNCAVAVDGQPTSTSRWSGTVVIDPDTSNNTAALTVLYHR